MALEQLEGKSTKLAGYDAYFEMVQSRKKLPHALQESLTNAFAKIPVLSFPEVSGGKGIMLSLKCSLLCILKGI